MLAGLVFRFTADPKKLAKEDHQAKYFFGKLRVASLCSDVNEEEALDASEEEVLDASIVGFV